MGMLDKNRREFLVGTGITIGGAALGSRLFAENRMIDSDWIVPESGSEPQNTADHGKMRGLMVDAGRLPESLEYYRRVIDFCADWELNTLHFRLADDQGSALRFASVPHLVNHKNAFAPEELGSLAEYGRTRGIDLIPELESFGHTGYITRSAAYAHLLDSEAQGPSDFTGVIPLHPETTQIFRELYREVAAIFPSIYLHAGCDEVNWGGSELSRKALQTKTRAQIWAEYLNSLDQIATGLERQMIVWGDVVLHKEPEVLGKLNKSIILMDWNYEDHSSAKIRDTFLKVSANGNRGIGAPALVRYKWGPRVGTEQLRNIDGYADAYLEEADPNALGVVLTNWVPSRYVQNSIWDGFAYAAVAFKNGTGTAQTSAFRHFVERHYRADWNEDWSEVFQIIYDAAPSVQEEPMPSPTKLSLRIPWSSEEQLAKALRTGSPKQNPFTRLRSLLVRLELQVLKNLADFQAFALCVEALERMLWRDAVVIEHAAKKPLGQESTTLLIQTIAERDQALADALSKDWNKGRFPDSPAKSELVFDLQPKDQLLFEWMQAAEYSASLASHPERFHSILVAAKLA